MVRREAQEYDGKSCSSEELYLLLADVNCYYDSIKSTQELHQCQDREHSLNLEDFFDGTAGSHCVSMGPLPKRMLPQSNTLSRERATYCDVQFVGSSDGNDDTREIKYYEESNEMMTHGNIAAAIAKEQMNLSMNPPNILSQMNVAVAMAKRRN